MSNYSRFTRTDTDTYALVYATPRDEANTPVLLTSYWPTLVDALAASESVKALGATDVRVESLVECDALESGDDATRVEFTTADGDTATVVQPGNMLAAVTAVIRGYGHLAYEQRSGMGGSYRLFTATDVHTGDTLRYRVNRFDAIETESDATDQEERVNDNGLTFAQWMAKVDRAINARVGLSSADLADACYWDSWADGVTPSDAAADALASDDMFSGIDY